MKKSITLEYRFLAYLLILFVFISITFTEKEMIRKILFEIPNTLYFQVSSLLIQLFSILFFCDNLISIIKMRTQIIVRIHNQFYFLFILHTLKIAVILMAVFSVYSYLTLSSPHLFEIIIIQTSTMGVVLSTVLLSKDIKMTRLILLVMMVQIIVRIL